MNTLLKAFLPILIFASLSFSAHAKKDDFLIIKERVVAELMKTPIDDGRIETIMDKMNEDGSFKGINYKDLSRTAGFPQRNHTYNLVYLAKAYNNIGNIYSGLKDYPQALDYYDKALKRIKEHQSQLRII